jgi:hypothetical protein
MPSMMSVSRIQQLLDMMPRSHIPEIQEMILEIHSKIKSGSIPESGSGNFFDLYGGHLSVLHGRLGVGIIVSEIPISNAQQWNPYEHPITGFERRMKQIEELWLGKRKAEACAAEAKARAAEAKIDARKSWRNYKQELLLSAEDMGVKYSILHERIRKLYVLNSKKLDIKERIQYNLKRYSIKCDNVLKGLSALTNELKTRTWENDHTYDTGLGGVFPEFRNCFKWYEVMDKYVQYWDTRLSMPVPTHA